MSEYKNEGSLVIKTILYIQILLSFFMVSLAYLTIYEERDIGDILMDFLGLIVITEIDNWYGMFFEIILDAFYKKETVMNPEYLQFKTDSISQASCCIYILFNS